MAVVVSYLTGILHQQERQFQHEGEREKETAFEGKLLGIK